MFRLSLVIVTLWVGALWSTGLSAYILFDTLQDKQQAGQLAGRLFTVVSYIGLFSGFYLLIDQLIAFGLQAYKKSVFWIIVIMLVLVLAGHFGIQPILAQLKSSALPSDVMQSVFAGRFKTWHGVASIAYLMECLLGIGLVLKIRH